MNTEPASLDAIPRLSYLQWLDIAAIEQQRFRDVLVTLEPHHWALPTDCDNWSVRDLCGHVLGSLHDNTSALRGLVTWRRASHAARASGRAPLDELTAAQVDKSADLPNEGIVSIYTTLMPKNLRGRRRIPSLLRRAPIIVDGTHYQLGHITSVILTRDLWMHRIDLTRAIGTDFVTTPDHDGVIVADLVGDWARCHGEPFTLHLDGPAGGSWQRGTNGPTLQLDAITYARTLAGRHPPTGLLNQRLLF